MANANAPRMSPAELRSRLFSPPTDDSPLPALAEDIIAPPLPARVVKRNDYSRFGTSSGSQAGVEIDALAAETAGAVNSRMTPLPDGRIDPARFRGIDPLLAPDLLSGDGETPEASEVASLREQNAELTRLIEEMRPVLEEASAQELRIQAREQELLTELIEREQQIKELEEKVASIPPKPKTRDELEEWSDELEQENAKLDQERRRLEEDRKQLLEDEEALEKGMRDMEVSMARERAVMARQETELKRLSAEIQHELELLQRGDGSLREQLSKFQRRHQEVLSRAAGGPPPAPIRTAEPVHAPPTQTAVKDSGFLRRMFRGNK